MPGGSVKRLIKGGIVLMEQTSQKVDMDHVRLSEDGRYVVILDQSKLPNLAEYLT